LFSGILFSGKEADMPRTSPYAISLTLEEQRELRALARKYTAPHFVVLRAKLVLLAAEGLENKEIAERLDLSRQAVTKWRKRFYERGLEGLRDETRPGRPCGFSPSAHRAGEGAGV
jgi:DNA-directed RNA polymerase specialized sigma24 family protein